MATLSENPFPNTKIASWECLDSNTARSPCPKCLKSRKYYCYTCCIPLPHISSKLPKVKAERAVQGNTYPFSKQSHQPYHTLNTRMSYIYIENCKPCAVSLPVKVDIIKHPNEIDGKSTSPHAAILAEDDVTIYTYPCIPDYDIEKVILVFPCEESLSLHKLLAQYSNKVAADSTETTISTLKNESLHTNDKDTNKLKETNELCKTQCCTDEQKSDHSKSSDKDTPGCETSANEVQSNCGKRKLEEITDTDESPTKQKKISPSVPFERVVFVDSTWNQTRSIINDERLKNLKKVELLARDTKFWRCQEGIPKSYLSTVEAIYYFMIDLHSLWMSSEYKGQYDNLLFFFCYMYNKIRSGSDGGKGIKAYQR